MTSWMNGDEWGLNIESAARLERRTSELQRGMIVFDREGNDRRIPDGDGLSIRIKFGALSAEPGQLTDYGKQTQ